MTVNDMERLFSTHHLQEKDRFAYWREVTSSVFGPTCNQQLTNASFDGQLGVKPLGGAAVTRICSQPIAYEGKRGKENTDDFFIAFSLCAEAYVTQHARQSRQHPGDIVLFDGARPYVCQYPQGDDQIVFSLPRGLVLSHIQNPERLLNMTLDGRSPLGKLAGSLVKEAWQAAPLSGVLGDRLIGSILDVLDTAFEAALGRGREPHDSHQTELLRRAQTFLLANLDNRALTPEVIAQAVHVSPRTLNRLFAKEGTTVMRWLWQQRLAACHAALRHRQFRTVSDAALSFGFSNLSHFSRAFRRAFGVSAQDVLKRT
ncbi:helix-turn-helix domain-containing protein [Dickeya fangzhongdai]|uniref:helix-turn-helix domain-containing protein n=1 Tax=Dickeya fangzhongdai TaxID=1778540 RepID=UPI002B2E1196|nr:helix-turn-helix domain-containing protein [Dickeya fangzhongdai]